MKIYRIAKVIEPINPKLQEAAKLVLDNFWPILAAAEKYHFSEEEIGEEVNNIRRERGLPGEAIMQLRRDVNKQYHSPKIISEMLQIPISDIVWYLRRTDPNINMKLSQGEELEIIKLKELGKTNKEIAKEMMILPDYIHEVFKRHNRPDLLQEKISNESLEKILQKYKTLVELGKTHHEVIKQIVQEDFIEEGRLRKLLRSKGIKVNTEYKKTSDYFDDTAKQEALAMLKSGISLKDIADHFSMNHITLSRILRKLDPLWYKENITEGKKKKIPEEIEFFIVDKFDKYSKSDIIDLVKKTFNYDLSYDHLYTVQKLHGLRKRKPSNINNKNYSMQEIQQQKEEKEKTPIVPEEKSMFSGLERYVPQEKTNIPVDEKTQKIVNFFKELKPTPKKTKEKVEYGNNWYKWYKISQNSKNTPEFKKWFGDWEDPEAFSSKRLMNKDKDSVSFGIGEDGKPKVFYHGTVGDFSKFEPGRKTFNSGLFGNWETYRAGMFFTPNPDHAGVFTNKGDENKGGNIMPVYLNVKYPLDVRYYIADDILEEFQKVGINPRWLSKFDWSHLDEEGGKLLVEACKKLGYDGIIFNDENPDNFKTEETWVVFDSNQIKSAIGNKGSYDSGNVDITASLNWYKIASIASADYSDARIIDIDELGQIIREKHEFIGWLSSSGEIWDLGNLSFANHRNFIRSKFFKEIALEEEKAPEGMTIDTYTFAYRKGWVRLYYRHNYDVIYAEGSSDGAGVNYSKLKNIEEITGVKVEMEWRNYSPEYRKDNVIAGVYNWYNWYKIARLDEKPILYNEILGHRTSNIIFGWLSPSGDFYRVDFAEHVPFIENYYKNDRDYLEKKVKINKNSKGVLSFDSLMYAYAKGWVRIGISIMGSRDWSYIDATGTSEALVSENLRRLGEAIGYRLDKSVIKNPDLVKYAYGINFIKVASIPEGTIIPHGSYSKLLDIMGETRTRDVFGWLSPKGDIHICDYYHHNTYIEYLLRNQKEFQKKRGINSTGVTVAYELGWIRLGIYGSGSYIDVYGKAEWITKNQSILNGLSSTMGWRLSITYSAQNN